MSVRIAMWSGPRNLSTATMRAWENRPDTVVVDEPLYAYYLAATGMDHPGRDEVIASQPTDWRVVVRSLTDGDLPDGATISYQKHMTHHVLPDVDLGTLAPLRHAFLIRDPARMIASYLRKREAASFGDFGLERQAEFFAREADRLGRAPPVVDASDVLANPEGVLRPLCVALGIDWDPAMLAWPAGRRATDGPWAPHWYQAVEASTGFGPPDPPPADLPDEARRLVARCRPYYQRLAVHRIRAAR